MTAPKESNSLLTQDQISRFREDGFLKLEQISSVDEIEWLTKVYNKLFKERVGREAGRHWDMVGHDEDNAQPARLPQILNPSESVPKLRDTLFRRNSLVIAKQLLGEEAQFWFDHAICKPAYYGAATPWHQDAAHRTEPGITYDQVSFWMPLQEATVENGCVHYVPGSHRGPVLDHRSPNNDPRLSALECVGGFDADRAVPCTLKAGGAAIHHWQTLHHAGPNLTSAPRIAYILAFRGAIRPDPSFRGYHWNAEKRTAAQSRSEAWQGRVSPLRGYKGAASRFGSGVKAALAGLRR